MDADYVSAKEYVRSEHYYGRVVRKFFLFGGFVMLFTLPFFSDRVPAALALSLFAIVIIGIAAGLLSPIARVVVVLNLLGALSATIVFEYQAVISYAVISSRAGGLFFAVNQILAVNFFLAVYYGSKTLRGVLFKTKFVNPEN